jgi:3-oxoacyl-[acyl-carrier protein] reductase
MKTVVTRDGLLSGKVAVVTGAASGIGAGITLAFAREGAQVAVVDMCVASEAQPVLDELAALGAVARFFRTDVSDAAAVSELADAVISHLGPVDVLVNNAGVFTQALVENMTVEEWDFVMGVNLRGMFLCTRAFLGGMLAVGDGRIINIASQLGQIGGAEAAHYSASKAGVIGFTKSLAREVSSRGVLVNAIAPGPINTPLLDSETEEWRSAKLGELPIGRFGEVSEVTPTAVLLASAGGAYYVGQTLGPNGGDVML